MTLEYVFRGMILNNFFLYVSLGISFRDIRKKLWSVGGVG